MLKLLYLWVREGHNVNIRLFYYTVYIQSILSRRGGGSKGEEEGGREVERQRGREGGTEGGRGGGGGV